MAQLLFVLSLPSAPLEDVVQVHIIGSLPLLASYEVVAGLALQMAK